MIRYFHGLRRDVSLLLSEGHTEARRYPIAVVWSEARIVRQRFSFRRREESLLMQMTIATVFDSSKKSSKQLADNLKRMEQND